MDPEEPRAWSVEKVTTFVRSLGPPECFQSTGDQVLQLGVDVSPHSHSIVYNGTGSLMFTPPPDTPFSHIVTNIELMDIELMDLFFTPSPPTPLFDPGVTFDYLRYRTRYLTHSGQ